MGQFSGSSVIQNYQSSFYAAVGITGKTSLFISGIYGIMCVIGQVIYLFVAADKWPRSRNLRVGSLFLSVMEDTENISGARATIAMIFLYCCG